MNATLTLIAPIFYADVVVANAPEQNLNNSSRAHLIFKHIFALFNQLWLISVVFFSFYFYITGRCDLFFHQGILRREEARTLTNPIN